MSTHSKKVLKSSFLLFSTKIVQRFLGLASTLLLARLLTPQDFGIVAIAALTIALFSILGQAGSEQYIIRKDAVDSEDLNSAWTIDIILKVTLWIILIVTTPLIANFLEKDIATVLYVLSFVLIFEALQNPGLFIYKKELEYKRLFYLTVTQKISSFFVVISLAFATHSYWAIIIGDIVAALVGLVGSFVVHEYRPRLSLSRVKEQWNFSKWMVLKGILGYGRYQIDSLFVSKIFVTADLGRYYLSKDISMMPFSELIAPITEPLLASFAKVKNDPKKLAFQCQVSILVVLLLITPVCFFIWHFPEAIVDTLLGAQWKETYGLFSYFSILLCASCIGIVLTQCFIVLGKVKTIFYYDAASLVAVGAGLLILMPGSLDQFALERGILQIFATLALLLLTLRIVNFSLQLTIFLSTPIVISSYISAYVTNLLNAHDQLFPLVSLIYNTAIFFGTYVVLLILFYAVYFKRLKETQKIKELIFIPINALLDKMLRRSK